MFKKNNIKKIKNNRFKISKKMILIILPVVVILGVIALITTGSLSKLMGSSITSYHCIDDTWKLEGTTCSKTTTKKAELFADINLDSKIDNSDLELLNYYIENNNKVDYTILSNIQLVLSDINGDGTIDNFDSGMLEYYITNPDKQSKDMVCEKGFKLNESNCELDERIPAEQDNGNVGGYNDQIVSFGFADFYKIRFGTTDVYIQYDRKNNKYFLDYGDDKNKTRVDVLTNSLESLKNEKEEYLAASNAFFFNNDTYYKSIDTKHISAGLYDGDENNVYVSPNDMGDIDYYKTIIKHEFGHSIDFMNDFITEKGGITSLSYNNQSFNDYYNKYKLNNLCGGKRCLRDYSYENTTEFWADLFSYDSQALDIDNNLLSLRTKMLEIYSNNYSNNKNKFNKIKADNQNIYVINYDSGTGTGITAIQTAVYNKTISLRSNSFYKEGNSFKGWHAKRSDGSWLCYTDKNKNKKNVSWTNESVCKQYDYYLYSDNEQVTGLAGVDDYVTMYAQWKSNVGDDLYTINYVDREEYNAYEVLKSEKVPYGNTILAPFVYSGKNYFKGWHAKRDDNYGYCYANLDKTSFDWYNQKTCNLYGYVLLEDQQYFWNADRNHKSFILEAQYEYEDKEVFSFYFDGNGATKGSMKSFKFSADVDCHMNSLPSNEFENRGYGFLGWYADTEDGRGYCYTNYDKTAAAWSDNETCSRFGHKLIENHSSYNRAGICDVNSNVTLKAQWANQRTNQRTKEYTIKFDKNGATSGSMKSINYSPSGDCSMNSLPENKFKNEGYGFLGWYADAEDGRGYCYTNYDKNAAAWSDKDACSRFGHKLTNNHSSYNRAGICEINSNVTLKAQWTKQYTLKFNKNHTDDAVDNEVSGSMKDELMIYGTPKSITLNSFKTSKKNYGFAGWHAKRGDGKWYCYTDSSKKKHAWSDKSVCEKNGYYLYKDGGVVTNTAEPGGSTTLYAQWTNEYTLKFDGNGATNGSMSNEKMIYGTPMSITKNGFSKDGYIFIGWNAKRSDGKWYCYTSPSKTSHNWLDKNSCDTNGYYLYKDKGVVTNTAEPGSYTTLYAQWAPPTFTIFFDKHHSDTSGATGNMDPQRITYNGNRVSLRKNQYTRSNYAFVGWYAKRDDGTWYCYTSDSPKNAKWSSKSKCVKFFLYKDELPVNNTGLPGKTVTMYAQWTNKFTLKFDGNGATKGSMKDQEIVYGVPTSITHVGFEKAGYAFIGWRAQRNDNKWYCYTSPSKMGTDWASKATCDSNGYYLYKDGLTVKDTANPGGYTTMHAQWVINKYRVLYNANGGTGSMSEQQMTYGVSTAMNANKFTKTGYDFTGWYAKRDDGTWYCYTNPGRSARAWTNAKTCGSYGYYLYKDKLKLSDTANPGGFVTMYAQWKTNQFTVRYNANGGTGSMADQKITYGVSTAMSANRFTKSGYDFTGWYAQRTDGTWYCYTNPGKSARAWTNAKTCGSYGYYLYKDKLKLSDTAPKGGLVTMYAQWKTNQFTVRYNANGGTGSMADQKITYGVSTALRANSFRKDGYKFVGWLAVRSDGYHYCYTSPSQTASAWSSSSTCSGFGHCLYKNQQKVSKTAGKGGLVTMYAQWKKN